jgi:hypothetical protein
VPSVALIEELAPGRTLVQIVGGTHDGEQVVVVGDGRHPAARTLAWYLDGDSPPASLRALPPAPPPTRSLTAARLAEAKACALLESLLSPRQLEDWRRDRRFWVPTPQGSVRLGQLYQLLFRPPAIGRDLVLCVVPVQPAHQSPMPEADVWANLLLLLHADPSRFFQTANWRVADGGSWHRGPAPVGPG